MLWLAIPTDRYDSTQRQLLLDDIERRMARIPGVAAVGAIDNMLLNPLSQQCKRIHVAGVTPPKGQTGFDVDFAAADSGFLDVDRASRIVRGRGIHAPRTRRGAPRVAIINEAMAQTVLAGQGSRSARRSARTRATYRVVGVTRTTKVRTLGEEPRPFIFTSFAQEFSATVMLVARTNGDADRTATQMLAALREVDPASWPFR